MRLALPIATRSLAWHRRSAGREAALPGRNFNDATRDRRFFSRLAVPPFALLPTDFSPVAPCLPCRPRLELATTQGDEIARYGARRGGRVVDRTALEMRHRCKPIGGSNPSLSASKPFARFRRFPPPSLNHK